MCGRLNVIADPLCSLVSNIVGINFTTSDNKDLCPSQHVATLMHFDGGFQQINSQWGIQPSWAKRLLINAQSETVATKSTFKHAFAQHRCLVPCLGWYEWRTENNTKVKYYFAYADNSPVFMAGILFNPQSPQLVTLTTAPNSECIKYHKRMPVLITPDNFEYWYQSDVSQLPPLLAANDDQEIIVTRA